MKIWHSNILIIIGKDKVKMAKDIVVLKSMGDALRNTGYKNIESAIAEIIDNSIQANSKDVFILISEKRNESTGRKHVNEFAFLDNGDGMDMETLGGCLGIGYTTRSDRKGMGRFGVGLPQASLHVTPSVDVYSWQGGYQNCHKVFLDINKIKSGEQNYIPDPQPAEIPEIYKKFLNYHTDDKTFNFQEHGSLVHWKECDNVNPKIMASVIDRLDFTLGQKFRYLIKDGDSAIHILNCSSNNPYIKSILPNDPLFLMNNNYVLGYKETPDKPIKPNDSDRTKAEPIFEPYTEDINNIEKKIVVKYTYKDPVTAESTVRESEVTLKFSVVKEIFYDQTAIAKDPGATNLGKYVAKMEGISVVRAKREIDFGYFDFYSNLNMPAHRWWGCEICFDPELDEAFGVANNKQHVELARLDEKDYEDDEVKPMWIQLSHIIMNTIKEMTKRNKTIRAKSRSTSNINTPTVDIINTAESNTSPDPEPTSENIIKAKEALEEQGVENPTDSEAITYFNNKVNIKYSNKSSNPLFDAETQFGDKIILTINKGHPFYTHFVEPLETQSNDNGSITDPNFKTTFELFIASLVKAKYESDPEYIATIDYLLNEWDYKLRKYIITQYGLGN